MKLVDANVLLYAANSSAPHHRASLSWLNSALAGGDVVGFAWLALLAFVRISSSPRVFDRPMTSSSATDQIARWLASPSARVLAPGGGHLAAFSSLLAVSGSTGNLVNDAHLAALAIEHRADVVTYDSDFDRFPGVRWARPEDLVADSS